MSVFIDADKVMERERMAGNCGAQMERSEE